MNRASDDKQKRSFFTGRGCLIGCGVCGALVLISVLGMAIFIGLTLREHCQKNSLSLDEAQKRCGISTNSAEGIDEAHAQALISSWVSLADGASMKLTQREVQELLQYLFSRPASQSSFSNQPGLRIYRGFVEKIVSATAPRVSIKPNSLEVCGVFKLSTSQLACPGLGDRADLYEASIVPVAGNDSPGLRIESIHLNGELVSPEALDDFQTGLQVALTKSPNRSESALFSRRQSITLGEGALTIRVIGSSEKEPN